MTEEKPNKNGEKFSIKRFFKKPVLIVAFILINIAVIAITAVSEFGNSSNAAKLSEVKINGWFLLPAVICFLIAITAEIYKYVMMMREMGGKKESFDAKKSWKVAF